MEMSSSTLYLAQQMSDSLSKSVYKYATHVHEIFEHPRQTKLDHDITKILGSSDPPPGFGFLHPRFYSFEQERPSPMKPLQVRRTYLQGLFNALLISTIVRSILFD